MRALWLAMAFLLLPAGAACAQTAEETVAFLIAGLADGAASGDVRAKETGASPASYALTRAGHDKDSGTVVITRKSDCLYDLAAHFLQNGNSTDFAATIDFAKIKDLPWNDGAMGNTSRVKVVGEDYCTGSHEVCSDLIQIREGVDRDKYKKTYDYFREKFCRGQAS